MYLINPLITVASRAVDDAEGEDRDRQRQDPADAVVKAGRGRLGVAGGVAPGSPAQSPARGRRRS